MLSSLRTRPWRRGLVVVATVATVLFPGHMPAVAADGWHYIDTGIAASLSGVACPTTTTCLGVSFSKVIGTTNGGSTWSTLLTSPPTSLGAVTCASATRCWVAGYNQTSSAIMATTDGGATWTTQKSGALGGTYDSIDAMDCPSTTHCWAVGTGNTPGIGYQADILATTNGGTTWVRQYLGPNSSWNAVSCASTSVCFVGGFGGVARTTNGGSSWAEVDGGQFWDVWSISCPSTTTCFAMTLSGDIWATTNTGASWTRQQTNTSGFMWGIACPSTSTCVAVGDDGQVISTTNGGLVWLPQISHTTQDLRAVDCPSTSTCYAVADDGTVIKTTNGGTGLGQNRPPAAPSLSSPPAGSTQSTQFPVVFTIRATDPDGHAYTGEVVVSDASTGTTVATFDTAPATTGANSSGTPGAPFAAGTYTWTARAVDELGLPGPWASASFVVV